MNCAGTGGGVPHSFITSWGNTTTFTPPTSFAFTTDPVVASLALKGQDQAIDYLLSGTLPPAVVTP